MQLINQFYENTRIYIKKSLLALVTNFKSDIRDYYNKSSQYQADLSMNLELPTMKINQSINDHITRYEIRTTVEILNFCLILLKKFLNNDNLDKDQLLEIFEIINMIFHKELEQINKFNTIQSDISEGINCLFHKGNAEFIDWYKIKGKPISDSLNSYLRDLENELDYHP